MEPQVRVSATTRKNYGAEWRWGQGFDIEKRGRGIAANQWLPVLQLIYKTEAESKEAEEAIRRAINNVVHIEGSSATF